MDERELIGLLHRADWTRLALSGTVRGGRPLSWEDLPREATMALVVAPGKRYRMTSEDGSRVVGSDGESAWQWFAEPPDASVRFEKRPQPPVPLLLDPVWLLLGYRLTIDGRATVCGRPGVSVTAVALRPGLRPGPRLGGLLPWGVPGRHERAVAVVDEELGFLLRCEFPGTEYETSFTALSVGEDIDGSVFGALEGSFFGDGSVASASASAGEQRDEEGAGHGPLEDLGLEAVKLVGGLAAGGLGAAIKFAPRWRPEPFAAATAEAADPDGVPPDDEPPLPDWALDPGVVPDASQGGPPVSDEVLELLYRGGIDPAPFRATAHQWIDSETLVSWLGGAVPESVRQAGFGGVGFLVDTVTGRYESDAPKAVHFAYGVRVGALDRYRVDLLPGPSWTDETGARHGAARLRDRQPVTVACDGERTYRVYADSVKVADAQPLGESQRELADLVDGNWLLGLRLSGGSPAVVDGRPGYRVIATERDGALKGTLEGTGVHGMFGWARWPPLSSLTWNRWLPATAVVDAETGRLLRVTRYVAGRVPIRVEFRAVAADDGADFSYEPPPGLPVTEDERPESSGSWRHVHEPGGPGGPDGPGEEFGNAAKAAADSAREQAAAAVDAARKFLDSFFGGDR